MLCPWPLAKAEFAGAPAQKRRRRCGAAERDSHRSPITVIRALILLKQVAFVAIPRSCVQHKCSKTQKARKDLHEESLPNSLPHASLDAEKKRTNPP